MVGLLLKIKWRDGIKREDGKMGRWGNGGMERRVKNLTCTFKSLNPTLTMGHWLAPSPAFLCFNCPIIEHRKENKEFKENKFCKYNPINGKMEI